MKRYKPLRRHKPLERSRVPLKRTPLRRVSDKRRRAGAEYARKREAFLEANPRCQAYQKILWGAPVGTTPSSQGWLEGETRTPPSTEVHHTAGRTGTNYLDETTWLAVCRLAHDWIHAHPSKARELGLLK